MSMPKGRSSIFAQIGGSQQDNLLSGSEPFDGPLLRSEACDDPHSGSDPPSDHHPGSNPPNDPLWQSEPPNNPSLSSAPEEIQAVIDHLKKQVASERAIYIEKKLGENAPKVVNVTKNFCELATERGNLKIGVDQSVKLWAKKDAVDLQNDIATSNGDEDGGTSQEEGYVSSTILLGSSIAVKNAVHPINLPEVERLPPYTTWVFLDRNQKITEDQSVVNRRRIYYDQNSGEALICSDSEEDAAEEEQEKKKFAESDDKILRMTVKVFGLSDVALDLLAQCFSIKHCEVKARYEDLLKEGNARVAQNGGNDGTVNSYLDKDLGAALDTFDKLFCRRCLVFGCRLHGCSQELIFPAEKQPPMCLPDTEKDPCGPNCFRLAFILEGNATVRSPVQGNFEEILLQPSDGGAQGPQRKHPLPSTRMCSRSSQSDSGSFNAKNVSESTDSETRPLNDVAAAQPPSSPPKSKLAGKCAIRKRNSKRIAEHVLVSMRKRQKNMLTSDPGPDLVKNGSLVLKDPTSHSNPCKENEDVSLSPMKAKSPNARRVKRKSPGLDNDKPLQNEAPICPQNGISRDHLVTSNNDTLRIDEYADENIYRLGLNDEKSWKPMEKSLYEKGLKMFGRKSCAIARNAMNGLKTCLDVFMHMNSSENKLFSQTVDGTNSLVEDCHKADGNETMGKGIRRKSRFLHRRSRVRRLKYTSKSARYHSMRKRISERKDLLYRHYNPCTCQSSCGKECPCLVNGTCCEKYCGCPKSCKNKFRGCHCAKSQCQSCQCPCFIADRECDPDVCRNCWISCGDSTLGTPLQRGNNFECRNMKLLLKQRQRVLLGRSDIAGWGAFLKNSVSKHEYLGEYTGELISHYDADKRGKLYDCKNSSFLFNLNDQFVLDALSMGDKLKFANHSPNPNCYAKVIMVSGDHRVGIFAKEQISAGEELFYDYCYEPDKALGWASKAETSGSKKEYAGPSSGHA